MDTSTPQHDPTRILILTTRSTRAQLRWLACAEGTTIKRVLARLVAEAYAKHPNVPQRLSTTEEPTL